MIYYLIYIRHLHTCTCMLHTHGAHMAHTHDNMHVMYNIAHTYVYVAMACAVYHICDTHVHTHTFHI